MDKHRKLRRYSRKDYSLLVDFPVEIVGRDGVVRRYTFEESIRLYQRRITSSNARYPDQDVATAEITHCRQRIEQLRRSYFARYGWASLRSSGALGLEEGLAGEVAAFLRRCLEGTDQDPESLRLSALAGCDEPIVLYVQRTGASEPPPPPNLLYVYRFPEEEPGQTREAFFGFLKILRGVRSQVEGVEALLAFHHSADCGLVLTGQFGDAMLHDPRRAGFMDMPVMDSAPIDEEPSQDPVRDALRALRAGRLRSALESFALAYEMNPWRRSAAVGCAAVADALGQFRDAETVALMGSRYFSSDPAIWYQLTLARLRLGELDAAEEALAHMAPLDGDRYAVALLDAFIAVRAGRTLPGLARLWRLRRLGPCPEADLAAAASWLGRVAVLWVFMRALVGVAVVLAGAMSVHHHWVALAVTGVGLALWFCLDIVAFRTIARTISRPDRVRLSRLDTLARTGEALPASAQ